MNANLSSVLPAPSLGLRPEDYFRATWREHIPLACPEVQPFDLEIAIAKLRQAKSSKSTSWNWDAAAIPRKMTKPEAEFWFRAIGYSNQAKSLKQMLIHLQTFSWTGVMPIEQAESQLAKGFVEPILILPLYYLFAPIDFLSLLANTEYEHHRLSVEGLSHYILPYMACGEYAELCQTFEDLPKRTLRLMSALGFSDNLLNYVTGFTAESCTSWRDMPAVFGLSSAELVQSHMKRLNLKLTESEHVRSCLAHTEYSQLDYIHDSIKAINSNKQFKEAVEMFKVFAQVRCLDMAKYMLSLSLASRVSGFATTWLRENLEWSIAGLLPIAAGRSRLAKPASDWIQRFQLEGQGALVQKLLAAASPTIIAKIQPLLQITEQLPERSTADLPEDLQKFRDALDQMTSADDKPLPEWVNLTALPRIATPTFSIPIALVQSMLLCVANNHTNVPPFIQAMKQIATPESLDRFIWLLFQQQQEEGYGIDCLMQDLMINLGGDLLISHLIEYQKRYFAGHDLIQILASLGTDYALRCLQQFKYCIKNSTFYFVAELALESIAAHRQISGTKLEDSIVPVLGFDSHGKYRFDFGDRYFMASIDPHLQVILQDQKGKTRSTLPKTTQKDDSVQAQAAIDTWKTWKPAVMREIKLQAIRLERLMAFGHTWSWMDFQADLLPHPVMNAIARTLLWTGQSETASVVFQIAEDHSFVGIDGREIDHHGFTGVCITHPATLSSEAAKQWGEHLSDYNIIQPFPQISRSTDLMGIEVDQENIFTYPHTHSVFSIAFTDRLAKLGWRECRSESRRVWRTFYLRLFGVAAVIFCEETPREYNYRQINQIIFVSETQLEGLADDRCRMPRLSENFAALPRESIPPPAFSEVFYQLGRLTAK